MHTIKPCLSIEFLPKLIFQVKYKIPSEVSSLVERKIVLIGTRWKLNLSCLVDSVNCPSTNLLESRVVSNVQNGSTLTLTHEVKSE